LKRKTNMADVQVSPMQVAYETIDCYQEMIKTAISGEGLDHIAPWQERTVPIYYKDDYVSSAIPLLMSIAVLGMFLFVTEKLGYFVADMAKLGHKKKTMANRLAIQERFVGSFTELIYYSGSIFVTIRLCKDEHYFHPMAWNAGTERFPLQNEMMADKYGEGTDFPALYSPKAIKAFCMLEGAWYLVNLISVVSKKKKKDFVEMVAHHIITAILIYWAIFQGHYRITIVVTFLHNLFDPFLQIAKCVHYLVPGNSKWHTISDVSFVVCTITFAVSRLIVYPFAVYCSIVSANVELPEYALNTLLSALYPIHIFWFFMLMKVLKKALAAGTIERDSRSDSESDSDDEEETKKDN